MDADIIVAVIGLIEAVVVILLPFAVSKYSQQKAKSITKAKILPYFLEPTGNKEIDADIDQIFDQATASSKLSSYTSV